MKKNTKRSLFFSVMALILCCALLAGTTLAWFTDTASTAVNKIQAGTLDVQLLDDRGNSLEGQMLAWQKAAGAPEGEQVLWEPGCTYNLQPITIKNNGNLALKYKIEITGIQGDAELNDVIDWTINDANLGADHSLAAGASAELTISGHMQESAGNEYQGKSIEGIGITVLATQDAVEYDSSSNTYDENAAYPIYGADEFANAVSGATSGSILTVASGSYDLPTAIPEGVTIAGVDKDTSVFQTNKTSISNHNVTIANTTINGAGSSGTSGSLNINGNNTTLDNVNYVGESGKIAIAVSTGTANEGTVFKNVNITNAFRGIQFWSLSGDTRIEDSVLDISGYTFNVDAVKPGATLTVKNTALNGWTSYTSGIELVSFEGCHFGLNAYEYLRPYSETELTNCDFTTAGYQLSAGGDGAYTITLTNCTRQGALITPENVRTMLDSEDWNRNATLIVNGTVVAVS